MRLPSSPRLNDYFESGIDRGMTKVVTDEECTCVCLFNDLLIIADPYDIKGKRGVYYEVVIWKMDGIIAIGNTSSAQLQSHGTGTANTVHDRNWMPSTPSVEVPVVGDVSALDLTSMITRNFMKTSILVGTTTPTDCWRRSRLETQ